MSLKGNTRMWIDPKRKAEWYREKMLITKDLETRVRYKLAAESLERLDREAKENAEVLRAREEERLKRSRKKVKRGLV